MKKFNLNSDGLKKSIQDGYIVVKNILRKVILIVFQEIFYLKLSNWKKYKDYHDICTIIMDGFEKSPAYDELIFQKNLKFNDKVFRN